MTNEKILLDRKIRIEKQLKDRGVSDCEIKYLPYLDFDDTTFATPYEVGARMIILYSCAYVANNLNEAKEISDWLKQENLWPHVSPQERELFDGKIKDEGKLSEFSWKVEAAYTLGWTLNLIDKLHSPTSELNEKQIVDFQNKKPTLGVKLGSYLDELSLRDKGDIFEENIFNELATTYFRDLLFNGHADTTDIDRFVSFERHSVLNWVRRFMDISDWDETDTST